MTLTISDPRFQSLPQLRSHPRDWKSNFYVYPVISRRSGGLSIGVNLNPDAACNFDCVYCQVDRTTPPRVREVELPRLEQELRTMIEVARSGTLFEDESFRDVPAEFHGIKDISFSGDGEPTTCPYFRDAVAIAARLRSEFELHDTKLVLITDACYLTRPTVKEGLAILDANNGEIWAKLDAGTEEYYRRVNEPNYPLRHVIENITSAARVRPVVIQSLFMRLDGVGPSESEIIAYTDRLNEIRIAGGRIKLVQVYTVARRPAQSFVGALSHAEVDAIRDQVRQRTGLLAESFYSGA
jgi:wyosine [tRNA(Phe)-imidazoG37] synthetase (radical SAM superfamily)